MTVTVGQATTAGSESSLQPEEAGKGQARRAPTSPLWDHSGGFTSPDSDVSPAEAWGPCLLVGPRLVGAKVQGARLKPTLGTTLWRPGTPLAQFPWPPAVGGGHRSRPVPRPRCLSPRRELERNEALAAWS